MLQSIRDRLTGILAFVVLGILVIPFAFVGVNSYFGSGTGNLVALVNDEEITFNQFNQSYLDYRRRMQAQLGEAFDPDEYSSEIARREHLDQMIDEVILRQTADSLGFSVSDERLAEEIRNIPAFQVDGQFSPEVYQARLISIGQTPKQFQNLMRADITVTQLPGGISRSSFATPRELDEFVAMSRQKRSFRYLEVPADEAAVTDEFTEDELQAAYEENRELFRTPEQVVIEYLELDPDNIDTGGDPGDDVLRARFEEQKQRFVTPEQRRVSHVLIEVTPDSDEVTTETARQEAEAIAERARAGEDFAALAEELSDDLGSASTGGDLGFIEPGVMVESFEDAVYELSLENPISDPVKTGFGWHVIKLNEVRESSGQTFEEARQTLLDEWREEQVEREFLDLADRMVDVVYEDPTTLEAAALDLGLEIQQAGPFSRSGGEGVAAEPDVVEAAFSDLVLLQGSVSDPVDLGPNHMIMLRVREHEPSAIQPLEEVRDQVTDVLRRERAREAAQERADGLLAQLDSGATLEDVAAAAGLEVGVAEEVERGGAEPDPVTVRNVFRLEAPEADSVARAVVEADSGYTLVELDTVVDGSMDENAELARRQAQMLLSNAGASFETYALLRQLRAGADVQVFEENLGQSR